MVLQSITDDVTGLLAQDWDRRLFDELIPLPEGTSYNAYLIEDDRSALIDSVDPSMAHVLFRDLDEKTDHLDYIIVNHAEQDHSGTVAELVKKYPEARVVTNEKCKVMLRNLLPLPEDRFLVVQDGNTLSLGEKTLEFIVFPWVHWPETMLTWLREDRILFTCDLFGSHRAGSTLFATEEVLPAAKRYYAEIMMPFRTVIAKNLHKVEEKDVRIIAPSHGPLYDDPAIILDAYREWMAEKPGREVMVAYVSMHGSTKAMVDHLVTGLMEREVPVRQFNLTEADVGELAMALVDASILVLASPTVLGGLHPVAASAAFLINALRPKLPHAVLIGSFGWGGRMVEQAQNLLGNLQTEMFDPVIARGYPTDEDMVALDALADRIADIS
jgi:flavorubredoxin